MMQMIKFVMLGSMDQGTMMYNDEQRHNEAPLITILKHNENLIVITQKYYKGDIVSQGIDIINLSAGNT